MIYAYKQIQIKLGWALFVTYTIIQSIMRSEMCSLHLTHPSVHTWSSGQPTVQRPGSSRGLPVGAGIRTHNLGLPRVSSPTLYPLGQRLPMLLLNICVRVGGTRHEWLGRSFIIIIDYQLKVIKTICKTIKTNLGCFMMIRNCLSLDCAFIWINSMILSHISYGLTTWSPVIRSLESPGQEENKVTSLPNSKQI